MKNTANIATTIGKTMLKILAESGISPGKVEEESQMLSKHENSVKARSQYNYMNGKEIPGLVNLLVLEEVTGKDIYGAIKEQFKNGNINYSISRKWG